jgi:U3 small nucleolar ribonucleoprotein component
MIKNEKSEKKDERHEQIRQQMQSLFIDLDALSNFRFTPRPVSEQYVRRSTIYDHLLI